MNQKHRRIIECCTHDFLDVIRENSGCISVRIHPELGVAVETDGQDWGGFERQNVITDVPHLDLRKGFGSVVGLKTLVITGTRFWSKQIKKIVSLNNFGTWYCR